MDTSNISTSKPNWLGYGAQFLTIFFALTVLTGRIYTLSYWSIETPFINYAIVSPNTTVASVFIAVGTVVMVLYFRRKPYDFVGDFSPTAAYIIGWSAFWVGLFAMGRITKVDSSAWTTGGVGIAFGLAFLCSIGGQILWMQAGLKQQKELSKLDKILFGWLRRVPIVSVQIFFMVVLVSSSLWFISDTAQKFGANEAKFMYNMKPFSTLYLDSPMGFEDMVLTVNPAGGATIQAKIVAQSNGLLYISPGIRKTSQKLQVRAVPTSRIKAIQYEVGVTPIGN